MNKAEAVELVNDYEDTIQDILSICNNESLDPEEAVDRIRSIAEEAVAEDQTEGDE